MESGDNLATAAIRASKWSALSELCAKAAVPFTFVVLARVLTPEDFGVVAAATMVVTFSQVFWDAGLSKALIQTKHDLAESMLVVFWTNAVLGVIIYAAVYVTADWVAALFGDERIALVVRVQGVQIVLTSLCSTQTAMYQRELNFRVLFWIRLLTTTMPSVAAIPLAFLGLGYWALVVGTLFGAGAQLVLTWRLRGWGPQWRYDQTLAKELLSFGLWVGSSGLLVWFYMWVDALVVGAYLDTRELGLYRTGNAFVTMCYGLLLSPVLPVLFSALSRMQDDRQRVATAVMRATKLVAIVALPAGAGLLVLREPIAELVFGQQWEGIGLVVGILGLMHACAWLVGCNGDAYRAIGRPDVETKIMLGGMMLYFPVYLLAIQYGLETFLWTRMLLIVVTLPVHFIVAKRILGLDYNLVLRELRWIIILAAAVWLVADIAREQLSSSMSGVAQGLLVGGSAMLLYCAGILVIERKYVRTTIVPIMRRLV